MEKIIQDILNKHGLELESTFRVPDGGNKRSFILFVTGTYGKKYTLKVFSSEDDTAYDRFIFEIDSIKSIRNNLRGSYKNWIPKIKAYSKNLEHPYYLYERVDGEPLGRFVEDYGYKWGLFRHKNFEQFIGFFDTISDLNVDYEIGRWGARHARKELQFYFENVKGLLPSDLYDKVYAFYDQHYKNLSKFLTLSHRDLYPENIMISSPGSSKFVFLDWEYLSKVPLGYNAAFLYLCFWREEYWKARVFSHFYNKYESDPAKINAFLVSFRFSLIILTIRFLYQIETYGKAKAGIEKDARLSFLYDLNLALSGEIVKPRNIKFLIDKNDIQKVADSYNLGLVDKYEIFYASKGNTVAKVVLQDKRVLVFRFYSLSRSRTLIRRELTIFDKLKNNGIETYNLIHTPDGGLFLDKEIYGKKRKIAVLSFVKGKKLQKKWANEKSISMAGELLRRIHNQNIIHGDYSKENVLFQKSKISGVIDLEWGRMTKSKAAKENDLAKAIALWLVDTRSKSLEDETMIVMFLKGYYSKFPKNDIVERIMNYTIDKIEGERSIFLTTIDTNQNKHGGMRFDNAINSVTSLRDGYKEKYIL